MKIDKDILYKNISGFLKANFLLVALILITLFIWIVNIKYKTYFIGWDNLQVELNYWLNLKRNIYSAWQEYQGLGLAAGHAHAVESVRLILFAPLYLIFPDWLFRYGFHFAMHLTGVLSVYYLLSIFIIPKNKKMIAFVGALFYMLNWGTVQIFYAALEPFSAFYAFLPLTIFLLFKYLYKDNIKNLFYLSLGFLLLSTSFQIQTFFVVYCFLIIFPLGLYLILQIFSGNFRRIKNIVYILISFGFINLYWLGNVAYFTLSNSDVRFESKTNKMASYESFLRNVEYSDFGDVFRLKNFWLSNTDYITDLKAFGFMMDPWIEWMNHPYINFISMIFIFIVIFGFISLIIYNHSKYRYFLIYIFLLAVFFIFNIRGPFGWVYEHTVLKINLLSEIFRFPFTKWGSTLSFIFSILLSVGLFYIFEKVFKFIKLSQPIYKYITLGIISLLITIYSIPSFRGHFIYSSLKTDIPDEYQLLFDYMGEQPKSKRIADLPQPNFWGWYFDKWGYRGSGFIWYGIEQPITSRTFDVWNIKNERFYDEFQYAVYSGDPLLLKYVLNKYQIDFILYDKYELVPGSPKATYEQETIALLNIIPEVKKVQDWGNIVLYEVDLHDDINNFIYAPANFSTSNEYSFTNIDSFSTKSNHNYISGSEVNIIHPFNDDAKLASELANDYLLIDDPQFNEAELLIRNRGREVYPARVDVQPNQLKIDLVKPIITDSKNNKIFPVSEKGISIDWEDEYDIYIDNLLVNNMGKRNIILYDDSYIIGANKESSLVENYSDRIFSANLSDCSGGVEKYAKLYDKYHGSIIIDSSLGGTCLNFVDEIKNDGAYIYKIEFESKNTQNAFPVYCLFDKADKQCLNNKYFNAPNKNTEYTPYVDYVFVDRNTDLSFHLAVETYDISESEVGSVSFKDIKVTQYPVVESMGITDLFSQFYEEGYIKIPVESNEFPLKIDLSEYNNFSKTYLPNEENKFFLKSVDNCNNFQDGEYSRVYNDAAYTYNARDAVSCDSVETRYPNPRADYLFTINSENLAGKPLNICIAGSSIDKCLIEDKLDPSIISQNYIVPKYNILGTYITNYYNESIAGITSKNRVEDLEYKLIPYNLLKDLSLIDRTSSISSENHISIESVDKINYFKYRVKVSGDSEINDVSNKNLLILNQSYENGWLIYNTSDCTLGIKTPFTCKKNIEYEHVLAKNWANGWLVPNQNAEYVIIFWPQYLQFIGYFVLISIFFIMVIQIFNKKRD